MGPRYGDGVEFGQHAERKRGGAGAAARKRQADQKIVFVGDVLEAEMQLIDHAAMRGFVHRRVVHRRAPRQPHAHRHRTEIFRPPHDRPPLHCGGYRPKAVNRRTKWQHRGKHKAMMVNPVPTMNCPSLLTA